MPTCLDLAAPQFVDGLRQRPHQANLRLGIRLLGEILLPSLDGFQMFGFDAFDGLVVVLAHVRIPGQELVDALDGRRAPVESDALGLDLIPVTVLGRARQIRFQVSDAAAANQRIAALQLRAEPWHEGSFANGVEP